MRQLYCYERISFVYLIFNPSLCAWSNNFFCRNSISQLKNISSNDNNSVFNIFSHLSFFCPYLGNKTKKIVIFTIICLHSIYSFSLQHYIAHRLAISSQTTDLTRQFREKSWRTSCNFSKDFLPSVIIYPKIILMYRKHGKGGEGEIFDSKFVHKARENYIFITIAHLL